MSFKGYPGAKEAHSRVVEAPRGVVEAHPGAAEELRPEPLKLTLELCPRALNLKLEP